MVDLYEKISWLHDGISSYNIVFAKKIADILKLPSNFNSKANYTFLGQFIKERIFTPCSGY